ncbi:MAG: hypothetical protein ACTS7E_02705 [Arsenophonus sp. NC-CH8-MAG3]
MLLNMLNIALADWRQHIIIYNGYLLSNPNKMTGIDDVEIKVPKVRN